MLECQEKNGELIKENKRLEEQLGSKDVQLRNLTQLLQIQATKSSQVKAMADKHMQEILSETIHSSIKEEILKQIDWLF